MLGGGSCPPRGSPHSNLSLSTHLQVNTFYEIQAVPSSQGLLCLIFAYSVSNRRVASPRLHAVLVELLNRKAHAARLTRHVPWSLGAAECPKLILNLLGVEGAQLPQQLCPGGTRWGFLRSDCMANTWKLSPPAPRFLTTAVRKPRSKQRTSWDVAFENIHVRDSEMLRVFWRWWTLCPCIKWSLLHWEISCDSSLGV